MLKLAVSTSILPRGALERGALKLLKDGGIDQLELVTARHRVNYDNPAYVDSLVAWIGELGLDVPLAHMPLSSPLLSHEIDLSALDEQLRIWSLEEVKKGAWVLGRLGGGVLVVHAGGRLADQDDRQLRMRQARTSVEELVSFCGPLGILLAVENMVPGYITGTAEELREFVVNFHPERVGICLDVGHANIGEGPATALGIVRDRLLTFHIADNHGAEDEHIMPTMGTLDWSSFMQGLACTGYTGWFTYELMPVADVTRSLLEIHRTFGELCQLMEERPEGQAT